MILHLAIFTGTRRDLRSQVARDTVRAEIQRINQLGNVTVLVGDCPRGVDRLVRETCAGLGVPTIQALAAWDSLGRVAGPARNATMVEIGQMATRSGATVEVLAFPCENSRGTLNCIRLAAAAGLSVKRFDIDP